MVDFDKHKQEEQEFWDSERYATWTARYFKLIRMRNRWFDNFWWSLWMTRSRTFARIEKVMRYAEHKRFEPLEEMRERHRQEWLEEDKKMQERGRCIVKQMCLESDVVNAAKNFVARRGLDYEAYAKLFDAVKTLWKFEDPDYEEVND